MAHEYRFKVKGDGAFPFDMLRYDDCYPANSEAVRGMESQSYEGNRIVELLSSHAPTAARWASFGWHVVEVEGGESKRRI